MAREYFLKNSEQIEQADSNLGVGLIGFDLGSSKDGPLDRGPRPEHFRGGFEFLVLQQAVNQLSAWVDQFFLFS